MSLLQIIMASGGPKIEGDKFNIWAFSDPHIPTNVGKLSTAIIDIDSEEWTIALNGGDSQEANSGITEANGIICADEINNFTIHKVSDVYPILGNEDQDNDENSADPHLLWRKYIDPLGENPTFSNVINAERPYVFNVLVPGNAQHTSGYLEIGNMLVILLGDRNDGPPPMGKFGTTGTTNQEKRRSGGISQDEWDAFTNLVENNTNKIILVMSHHAIYETTIGSGYEEFYQALNQDANYDYDANPNFADPEEARKSGYLAFIENLDATATIDTWLQSYGQYIDVWMSGHYHRKVGETWNGRSRKEEKYGTTFINISPINTIWHVVYADLLESKSNMLQIDGNQMTVKTYIHQDPNAVLPKGFYNNEEFTITLKRKFFLT